MSTTHPSQAQPGSVNQGECVVCGKTCSTRCSACAKGGLDWMYFCSREHQTFIWTTHKRVCGAKFRWPLITKKEKEEWRKLSFHEIIGPPARLKNWNSMIESRELSFDELLAQFEANRPPSLRLPEVSLAQVRMFRGMAFHIRQQKKLGELDDPSTSTSLGVYTEMAQDPFGYLAHCLIDPKYVSWDEVEEHESSSDLLHRLMIFFAVLCRHYESPELYVREHSKLIQHTKKEVLKVVDGRLAKDLPSQARELGLKLRTSSLTSVEDSKTGDRVVVWCFDRGPLVSSETMFKDVGPLNPTHPLFEKYGLNT